MESFGPTPAALRENEVRVVSDALSAPGQVGHPLSMPNSSTLGNCCMGSHRSEVAFARREVREHISVHLVGQPSKGRQGEKRPGPKSQSGLQPLFHDRHPRGATSAFCTWRRHPPPRFALCAFGENSAPGAVEGWQRPITIRVMVIFLTDGLGLPPPCRCQLRAPQCGLPCTLACRIQMHQRIKGRSRLPALTKILGSSSFAADPPTPVERQP